MRYYANALPQYATKLLRIDAPVTGDMVADFEAWTRAKAETWSVRHGWTPYVGAQAEILGTGDWDAIGSDDVVDVQANMLAAHEKYYGAK